MSTINRDSEATYDELNPHASILLEENLLPQRKNPYPNEDSVAALASAQMEPLPKRQRLQALDIYRGLTMLGMIVVDNMGPYSPWFLDHRPWDGLTPADLIFPAFLFIMGMALPLAVSQKRPIRLRNVIRIIGLFGIGIFLNMLGKKFDFEHLRIMGILQRLSLCYGCILLLHCVTRYGTTSRKVLGSLFMVVVFVVYISFMLSWSDPDGGCPQSNNLSEECNFVGYVDRAVLTRDHIYRQGFTDPEGIFSTLTAAVTTYAGYYFSLVMLKHKGHRYRMLRFWLAASVLCGCLVYPLMRVMPLNKHIYSASFTLAAIAICGVMVTLFVLLIDMLPLRCPRLAKIVLLVCSPLKWLGLNPLAIFVLMDLVGILMIRYILLGEDGKSLWTLFYETCFANWIENQEIASTVFACFFVVFWVAVAGLMYRFKLFFKL